MKYLILIALFISSAMADVWYYGSGEAVNLENNIGFDKHSQKILTGDTDDPSSVAKSAAQGSIYLRAGGGVYFKTDNGSSTNWSLIPGSFSVSAPLSYALNNISIPKSDATHDGYLSQGDWATFNGKQNALTPGNVSTSTTGVTIGNGTGATVGPSTTIDIATASALATGLLTSADWSTFNGKQNALTFGSVSTSTTGVTVGNGTNSTVGPNVTVDVQTASALQPGLLSAADWSTFNGKEPAQTKGSVSTSTTGVTIGNGSNSTVGPNVTVDVATASGTTTGLLTSGDWTTFNNKIGSLVVTTKGDLLTFSTVPARLGVGTTGQILSADSTTATGLKWVDPSTFTDLWTLNGSDIYRNSNVGIGITNPAHPLSVVGNSYFNGNVGVGNASTAYKLDVTGDINSTVNVRTPLLSFYSNSKTTAFEGSGAASADTYYTLPPADGAANSALITNGSGTLSWSRTFPVPLGGVFYGSITYVGNTNCVWSHSTLNAFTSFSADTDCNTGVLKGSAIDPGSKIPAIKFNSMPAGHYVFVVSGLLDADPTGSADSPQLDTRLNDGTNSTSIAFIGAGTADGAWIEISGLSYSVDLSSAQGVTTWNFQSRITNSGTANIYNHVAGNTDFKISVYYYPNITATAITGGGTVKTWQGKHGDNCFWDNTSATYALAAADASCTFTPNTLSSNFPTVTECAAGKSCLTFTPDETGNLTICVATSHGTDVGNTAKIALFDGSTQISADHGITSNANAMQKVCGITKISSLSAKTINLMGKDSTHHSYYGSQISGTVTYWDMTFIPDVIMPAITGSVASNGNAIIRTETAYITNTGTPNVSWQSGNWISSLTDNGVGDTTINFSTGMFSSNVACTATPVASVIAYRATTGAFSSTGVTVWIWDTSNNKADNGFTLTCSGTRGSAN